ncbi:MAG: hypothetical protein HY823_10120 [Acidobacteria bacterium]|nr:hypothetical protein [Acidobacteriota bacterium]
MPEIPAYERDPRMKELATRALIAGEEGGRPFLILEDTILYPEGGGQPADRGFLGEVEVLDVQKGPEGIRHHLASPLPPGNYHLRLDWTRRFDHMQQHTGQHLLTALAQDRLGWATTAFHLGPQVSDIELDAPRVGAGDLDRLEEAVAAEIRTGRPIRARRVSPEACAGEKVRSRGLPEGHAGDIRLVEIEGLDLNTCGGTHLEHTGEIEGLKLLGTESLRGGTRLYFVAGGRLRRRLGDHEARNAELRTLLGVPDPDLPSAVQLRQEQLRGAERTLRRLEEEFAEVLAPSLAGEAACLLERHCEGRDQAFLLRLAKAVTGMAPTKALFLTGGEGPHPFLLMAGSDCPLDVAGLGREIAGLLEAKGGGSGASFQGKAASLARRDAALQRLRAALTPSP